jgi:thiamine transport system ATP-binding protein
LEAAVLHLDHLTLVQDGFHLTANWAIAPGTRLALLGGSGEGKSTLLNALAGFLAPQSGRILWQGHDLGPLSPAERPVAILFQDQNLFPHLTLAQNLGLALNPRLRLTPADHARIAQVLERLGLSGMAARKPAQLSGGQQGRAALGRVLLQARPILLLDEPFAALGPALKADLLALVAELAAEAATTVVLVTHDPEDARRFADQVVLVHDGVADAPVATAALFANPPAALRAYLGQ